MIEFYHQAFDHYFVTCVADEIAKLDNGTFIGWARTGQSFKVYTTDAGRERRPYAGSTFRRARATATSSGATRTSATATMAKNPTFILESSTFFYLFPPNLGNCAAGTGPGLSRVHGTAADANHRYTTDRATRDQMVAKGWIAEGDGDDTVTMCAPQ